MIKFKIDGKEVTANKNETILNVARREGIYIPTMCYLSKVSPIASCRLCVVEVEGVNGFVLSCQTPPTEGISVVTNSSELFKERQNIMKLYDVNHPLQCGVCDKSGACDLQNKTLEFRVTNQTFSTKDKKREIKDWNFIQYDPSLCIMCERCVSTCNEAIGDDAIEVYFGGYGSHIVPKDSDTLDCTFCGECIAVCPVGAMTSRDFKYTANAWELSKIPSSCMHCSSACHLYYEVKSPNRDGKNNERIFRVTNEEEFASLCGAGRFGFDFENRVESKNEKAFKDAIKAFRNARTVKFTSEITNEEALILQRLKEEYDFNLVNDEAYAFKSFLDTFTQTSGSYYNATLEDVKKSDFIIIAGSFIKNENPAVRFASSIAFKNNRADITVFHPVVDEYISNTVSSFIKYEPGSEEGVMAMLLEAFVENTKIPQELKEYINNLDMGYISAESSIGEEEIEELKKKSARRSNFTLILGEDLYNHPNAKNIAKLSALMQKYSKFKVLLIPPKVNSLGVSLICDLDEKEEGYTVGYNTKADFILTSLGAKGENELDMPALNQQEGTFTNIDKRVVPINVALSYNGYTLFDIAKELGVIQDKEYTVQFSKELPVSKGYKEISFDELENYYDIGGKELRGYELESINFEQKHKIADDVDDIDTYNGTIIYLCNPVLQFNRWSAKAKQLRIEQKIRGSSQFAVAAKIKDNDLIEVEIDGEKFKRVFSIDNSLKGVIAFFDTFNQDINAVETLNGYRYKRAKIQVVGSSK